MIIECFDKKIEIEEYSVDGTIYTNCLVRNKEVILFPEEKIRQAFLLYLFNSIRLHQNDFVVKCEHKTLDIAIYRKNSHNLFQPFNSPILIVELKRKSVDLIHYEDQLLDYLDMHFCDTGILCNCKNVYIYSEKNNFKRTKSNIVEVTKLLRSIESDVDLKLFEAATKGDLDSFLDLIQKYGRSNKFCFVCSGFNTPIEVFMLSHSSDFIFFDFCGLRSRKKQPRIDKRNFVKLISIHGL